MLLIRASIQEFLIFPFNRMLCGYARKYLKVPVTLYVTTKLLSNHHKFILFPVELPVPNYSLLKYQNIARVITQLPDTFHNFKLN